MTDKEKLAKLEQYCAYSERCSQDVKQKCRKLEIKPEETDAYLLRLYEDGFLNDKRYAQIFIKSKTLRGWGPSKIRAALAQKQINASLFADILKSLDEEEALESIKKIAEKKSRTLKAGDEKELKAKLIRFLMGRGFEYNTIKKAIG